MLGGKESKCKGPEVRASPVCLRKGLKPTVAQNNREKMKLRRSAGATSSAIFLVSSAF